VKKPYKIASGFAPFSPCSDRFNPAGYRDACSLEAQFQQAKEVKGLLGIGLDYPYQFDEPSDILPLLDQYGLEMVTVEIGLYPDRKWKDGTYTAPDPGIRRDAVEMSKMALAAASQLGAEDVLMWPGQDGFDYPFESDYKREWRLIVDAIAEVADSHPDVKIAIEYKKQEPRANCYIRNAGVLLSLLKDIGLSNVGACIDLGHSLAAGENPAEAAVLLDNAGKLFQVHINDNYRDWDHDLIVGSVSFWETMEFFYWLQRCNYDGWYLLDIYPYRINGAAALQEGVDRTIMFIDAARKIDTKYLQNALHQGSLIDAQREIWDLLLKKE
jgi:xylose isomerase